MNINLIILKSGQVIVAQSEELEYEPRCHMVHPHLVSGEKNVVLKRWPSYTQDDHILLRGDDLLTVCQPTPEVRAAYLKRIGLTEEDLTAAAAPVILNEETEPLLEADDDYEPRYVEDF